MRQYNYLDFTSNWDRSYITLDYQENISYDGNGNILTYGRNGDAANTAQTIDSLTYNYNYTSGKLTNNKLNYVHDAIISSGYNLDIRNQTSTTNYQYDATGNLLSDAYAGITNTGWTVYNKPDTIYKAAGNITYAYNTANQRIIKTYGGVTTWYIRDAQGNVMGIYDNTHGNINWREQHLYGSSRLGMWKPDINLATGASLNTWDTTGYREYELDNHLGNMLTTISDLRIPFNIPTATYFASRVVAAQDYYAFGMPEPNRIYVATGDSSYRYGFNGKENDNEIMGYENSQDYGERFYDSRFGRFRSVDPVASKYPMLSSYQFTSNRPIDGININGKEYGTVHVNTYQEQGDAATTYTYTPYDPTQSNASGPLGAGVIYDITNYFDNGDGTLVAFHYTRFVARQATFATIFKTDYGNYYGATPLFEFDKYGSLETDIQNPKLNLDIPAVDAVDKGAKGHDLGYDKLLALGGSALFNDWGTTPVDEMALSTWTKFLRSYKAGDEDPTGHANVTQAEYDAASNGATLFSIVAGHKKAGIAEFMATHYRDAKPIKPEMSLSEISSAQEFNYRMFINLYLTKDQDGNYIRNLPMWNVDKEGNWTPKPPPNEK